MRILLASVLVAACSGFLQEVGEAAPPRNNGTNMSGKNMDYIAIPSELSIAVPATVKEKMLSETKNDQLPKSEVNGIANYRSMYQVGWMQCLDLYEKTSDFKKLNGPAFTTQIGDFSSLRGASDGYSACKARLRELTEHHDVPSIREAIRGHIKSFKKDDTLNPKPQATGPANANSSKSAEYPATTGPAKK